LRINSKVLILICRIFALPISRAVNLARQVPYIYFIVSLIERKSLRNVGDAIIIRLGDKDKIILQMENSEKWPFRVSITDKFIFSSQHRRINSIEEEMISISNMSHTRTYACA